MSNVDIVYEKIHYRHDPRWTGRLGPANGGTMLCVACVIEMMETAEVSSVRKSVVLAGVGGVLKRCPGVLRELLLQDHRVCLHFAASLLGMLHTVEDQATLEQVIQVLVQLLLELKSEQLVQYVLEEVHTQLCEQSSVRGFLPTFIFLGKLVDSVPALPQTLASQHIPLLEQLSAGLLFPDEALKSSVCYIFRGVWGCAVTAQSVPPPLRDRLCALLLQTLSQACSPQLTINCLGFLKQLLKLGEVVSVLMNCHTEQDLAETHCSKDLDQRQDTRVTPKRCSLPLILKKLLLSGDETLQVASAQCMAAILVHSPSQYCPPFIEADIPEFLCERLCSRSEVLLWSVYSCLLLLAEDPAFFSQCHSVYGIESLIRSLKEALRLNSTEVQRQGLLLLTEILERQPVGVRLFPSGPGFVGAAEVVVGGVSSPCLQVATQAAHAASALLRVNHQSSPVQYKELKEAVEAVTARCTELPSPTTAHRRGTRAGTEHSSHSSRAGGFLLQALVCFRAACSLAERCAGDPGLRENAFTAPDRQSEDTLDSFCLYLLHRCDTVCVPTVTRYCERAASASVLQQFFTILSCQFSLLPALMPAFSTKLASSGFFRLALEYKAAFCAGDRNPALNEACSDFLQRLSVSLLSQMDTHPQDCEEMEGVLKRCLPSLCCRLSEWPSLLCEAAGPRVTQYCLLTLLYLAMQHGDRLLPEPSMFSSVVAVLCSVQEQGGSAPPPCVLRAGLYLLSVTQEKSPNLDWAPLNCVIKALSSCPHFSSIYTHHHSLLYFVFRYPELAERFGMRVLELWLTHGTGSEGGDGEEAPDPSKPEQNRNTLVLLSLVEKNPTSVLTLLGIVCTRETQAACSALAVLRSFLLARARCDSAISALLRPRLLQVLQRLAVEDAEGHGAGQGAPSPLPLVLQLLCLVQSGVSAETEMDGTDFKLLYHVSNLVGKLKVSCTELLLPALNYLYCCVGLSPAHCVDRAVSMLLCNTGLMDQLQAVLNLSPSPSSSSSSLLCCARLLLSSLVRLQHTHSAKVHKSIALDLDRTVQLLVLEKRKTDSLLLASFLRLLQTVLDVDLQSPLVTLTAIPSTQRPLQGAESALYPLGSHRAHCLITALYSLLLQKQELLLSGSANCLGSLLGFLSRRSPDTALHVARQPWSRFLVYALLNSGESCLLHPAVLQLLSLLVRFGSKTVLWDPDLEQVFEVVDRRGLKELGESTVQALKQLLTQVLGGISHEGPTLKHRQRAQSLLDSLSSLPASDTQHDRVLRAGELSVCLSDFTVKTG
ncbi:meiosis inhibitor protein 1 [Megalops cyprinoides]|uniref:meiosis inhibitor protein 1 n=1 Tax=Megalops cyprinoides TaxID=118141 RepID=UPI0018642AD7|nr:meiosis inhibitor protein 1 [Megalops cyprinoides]